MWDEKWDFSANTRPLKIKVTQGFDRIATRWARQNRRHLDRILANVEWNVRDAISKSSSHCGQRYNDVCRHLASRLIEGGRVTACDPK
jgi:hypothetical protein